MYVIVKNPRTGELKNLKIGWSWILFFWSGLFGLPLFLRHLYGWGTLFLVLVMLNLIIQVSALGQHTDIANHAAVLSHASVQSDDGNPLQVLLPILIWLLSIFSGIRGNALTGRGYIDRGWLFSEPNSDAAIYARNAWRLPA